VESLTRIINNQLTAETANESKKARLRELEDDKRVVESTKKHMAREIVNGIMDLWKELTPDRNIAEEDKQFMEQVYESNPRFAYLSQPMVVAASHLRRAVGKNQLDSASSTLKMAHDQMASMIGRLNGAPSAETAAAAAAPAPTWIPVAAAAPVAVAASGRAGEAAAAVEPPMPAILANLAPYTGSVGRVTLDMLRK
jgi:hypothetical protein